MCACGRAARLFGKAGSRLKDLQSELRGTMHRSADKADSAVTLHPDASPDQAQAGPASMSGDVQSRAVEGLEGAGSGLGSGSGSGLGQPPASGAARGSELAAKAAGLGRRITGQLRGVRPSSRRAAAPAAGGAVQDPKASREPSAAAHPSTATGSAQGGDAELHEFVSGGLSLEELLLPPVCRRD